MTLVHCSAGWQRLLGFSEDVDAVLVGRRCVKLMTLQLPRAESILALVGRQEELEAEMLGFFLGLSEKDVCACVCAWNS